MNINSYKLFSILAIGFSKRLKMVSIEYTYSYFLILKLLQKENFIRFFEVCLKGKKYYLNIYLSNRSYYTSWKSVSKVENKVYLKTFKTHKKNNVKISKMKNFALSNVNKQNLSLVAFSNSNFGLYFTKCFGECLFTIR